LPCFFSLKKDAAEESDLKLGQTAQWIFVLWVYWLEKLFEWGEGGN